MIAKNVFNIIINKVLDAASFIFILANKTNTGTIINPPPIPKRPVRIFATAKDYGQSIPAGATPRKNKRRAVTKYKRVEVVTGPPPRIPPPVSTMRLDSGGRGVCVS